MQMQDIAFRPISNEIEKTQNTRKWKHFRGESISSYVEKKGKVLRLYPEMQATPTVHVRAYTSPKSYKI